LPKKNKVAKVLGMGNALVDIMTNLEDDAILDQFNLPKGSMQLVDHEFSNFVHEGTNHLNKQIASGGSAANAIHGLARLSIETGFIGKVGNDDFGRFFKADMESVGIKPMLLSGNSATGKAIALISRDSERTFATYLGAAVELSSEDITADHFVDYDFFHIEGYLVQNHALIERAVKMAKQKGLKITLDMASYNVVEENLDFLHMILREYVDIVFANEDEAKAFTGKDPMEAANDFGSLCEIAVIKIGKNGSIVKNRANSHQIAPFKATSIDTTGAGDLYAAGFIYGLINDYSLDKCGSLGSLLAAKTIEVIGPKMNDKAWSEIRHLIKSI
jgi:sugar/nucleoside kinase (ribokinase family)